MASSTAADELRRLERRIRRQLDARTAARRVWDSVPAIVQILAAVAAAYSIAHWGLGHAIPLLAVTVTINSLGFARDARPIRVAETVLGILLGIALGDALALLVRPGALAAARRARGRVRGRPRGVGEPRRSRSRRPCRRRSSCCCRRPTADRSRRSLDALVGGVVALLATALIPRDPRRAVAREARDSVLGVRRGARLGRRRAAGRRRGRGRARARRGCAAPSR